VEKEKMSIPLAYAPTEEKLVSLPNISWEQFKAIEAQLGNNRSVRLSYLSGILEIMSPIGSRHKRVKSTLGLLIEAYMREMNIRFYVTGGFTIEEPGYASGTPDESYCIGSDKETPDIVIEIIITSGTIDRKELYKPRKVPEVWFWKSDTIRIHYVEKLLMAKRFLANYNRSCNGIVSRLVKIIGNS
jgi:Uma2 family endonuclease